MSHKLGCTCTKFPNQKTIFSEVGDPSSAVGEEPISKGWRSLTGGTTGVLSKIITQAICVDFWRISMSRVRRTSAPGLEGHPKVTEPILWLDLVRVLRLDVVSIRQSSCGSCETSIVGQQKIGILLTTHVPVVGTRYWRFLSYSQSSP